MRPPAAALAIAVALAFAAGLLASCGGGDGDASSTTDVDVRIGELEVTAEVADTAAARGLGLGERDSLDPNRGMLFVFPQASQHAFWMKGMRFPLDFVWISEELRVVDLLEGVPPPEDGAPDSSLTLYRPSEDVLYVLEVNAGIIDEDGVAIGDEVVIEGGPPVTSE